MVELSRTRMIAILSLIILVVAFIAGMILSPSFEKETQTISEKYSGDIKGRCFKCIMQEEVEYLYNGSLSGKFVGRMDYEGREYEANISIQRGYFQGTLDGTYTGNRFSGNIEGKVDAYIVGRLTETRFITTPLQLPTWLISLIVAVVLILLFKYAGVFDFIYAKILAPERRKEIKKTQRELDYELRQCLWEDGYVLHKIRKRRWAPSVDTLVVLYSFELGGNFIGEVMIAEYDKTTGWRILGPIDPADEDRYFPIQSKFKRGKGSMEDLNKMMESMGAVKLAQYNKEKENK